MLPVLKRSLCAALLLAFAPGIGVTIAQAQSLAENYPAIATGLSIPSEASASGSFGSPAATRSRSVLIDAASATLYMFEGDRIVDSMKVIVGKPTAATPELKSSLTYVTVNPYWHVPADLTRTLTASKVLEHGTSYLTERGYEVLSSFRADAQVIDPATVDWQAVAEGRERVYVRQRPGPANSMGQMKFSLADSRDIYLHDTPMKDLFDQEQRSLSAGCVRLEDAERFARWLLGGVAPVSASAPEQHLPLRRQVPIVITYLDPLAQTQLAALR